MLDVILPLLNDAVLGLYQLQTFKEALVLFLYQIEDGEGLEYIQRDVTHVRVETDEALEVRVSVKLNDFFFHVDLHFSSRLLR
jgi:hypothetical protein